MPWLVPTDAPECREGLKQLNKINKLDTPEFHLELKSKIAKRIK
jgi:hypothetical protein